MDSSATPGDGITFAHPNSALVEIKAATMSDPRVYFPLNEVANIRKFPLGDILDDSVLKHIWITGPWLDTTTGEGVVGVLVNEAISFKIPGIPWLSLRLARSSAL